MEVLVKHKLTNLSGTAQKIVLNIIETMVNQGILDWDHFKL